MGRHHFGKITVSYLLHQGFKNSLVIRLVPEVFWVNRSIVKWEVLLRILSGRPARRLWNSTRRVLEVVLTVCPWRRQPLYLRQLFLSPCYHSLNVHYIVRHSNRTNLSLPYISGGAWAFFPFFFLSLFDYLLPNCITIQFRKQSLGVLCFLRFIRLKAYFQSLVVVGCRWKEFLR